MLVHHPVSATAVGPDSGRALRLSPSITNTKSTSKSAQAADVGSHDNQFAGTTPSPSIVSTHSQAAPPSPLLTSILTETSNSCDISCLSSKDKMTGKNTVEPVQNTTSIDDRNDIRSPPFLKMNQSNP
ncbi:hypothetical protein DSL72_003979 [Monilinia vaccinii-corymbosi]|uniref:Uncharacterized protein n=1 Tax=Monilinia vaccinii-corymbosi TaxID=61207 RepID=A0A8A3NUU1_9HELO|nr:hypothetical protein DSL72_003979 [Monilinia vaccinii-corymbosi]